MHFVLKWCRCCMPHVSEDHSRRFVQILQLPHIATSFILTGGWFARLNALETTTLCNVIVGCGLQIQWSCDMNGVMISGNVTS